LLDQAVYRQYAPPASGAILRNAEFEAGSADKSAPGRWISLKEKRLFSGLFGGEGLFEPGDVYEDENVLILHGRHGLTWTAVVAKDTDRQSW
jgi:hypothetical protein